MGRKIPEQQQGIGQLLPNSICLVEGRTFEPKPTQNGKHAFSARGEVIEPEELKGSTLFDQFVIGSDADPEAMKDETLLNSFGMKRVVTMFEAGGYDVRGQDEEVLSATYAGMRYLVSVQLQKEPDVIQFGENKGQPNPYAGNERNNCKNYWPVGEREPMVMPASGAGSVKTGSPKATALAKTAPPAANGADTAPPAAAPKAAPKAAPAKAAGAPPKAAATKPKTATAQTVKCVVPECGEEVALSDFPTHVAEKHPEA